MYFLEVLLYGCLATSVFSCFVERDYKKPMSYLLNKSDIVVYGEDMEHIEVNTSMELIPTALNSLFRIYCILKSDGKEINENITIETIKPRSSCSITWHDIGDKVIVSLRRTDSGNFEWHEVNNLQSGAFEGTDDNFNEAAIVLNSQKWKPPSDAVVNMCPIEYMTMEGAPEFEEIRSSDSEDKQSGPNRTDTDSDFESAPKYEDNSQNIGSNQTDSDSDSKDAPNSEDNEKDMDKINSDAKQTDSNSGSNSENNLAVQKAPNSQSDGNLAGRIIPNVAVLIGTFIFMFINHI